MAASHNHHQGQDQLHQQHEPQLDASSTRRACLSSPCEEPAAPAAEAAAADGEAPLPGPGPAEGPLGPDQALSCVGDGAGGDGLLLTTAAEAAGPDDDDGGVTAALWSPISDSIRSRRRDGGYGNSMDSSGYSGMARGAVVAAQAAAALQAPRLPAPPQKQRHSLNSFGGSAAAAVAPAAASVSLSIAPPLPPAAGPASLCSTSSLQQLFWQARATNGSSGMAGGVNGGGRVVSSATAARTSVEQASPAAMTAAAELMGQVFKISDFGLSMHVRRGGGHGWEKGLDGKWGGGEEGRGAGAGVQPTRSLVVVISLPMHRVCFTASLCITLTDASE